RGHAANALAVARRASDAEDAHLDADALSRRVLAARAVSDRRRPRRLEANGRVRVGRRARRSARLAPPGCLKTACAGDPSHISPALRDQFECEFVRSVMRALLWAVYALTIRAADAAAAAWVRDTTVRRANSSRKSPRTRQLAGASVRIVRI